MEGGRFYLKPSNIWKQSFLYGPLTEWNCIVKFRCHLKIKSMMVTKINEYLLRIPNKCTQGIFISFTMYFLASYMSQIRNGNEWPLERCKMIL